MIPALKFKSTQSVFTYLMITNGFMETYAAIGQIRVIGVSGRCDTGACGKYMLHLQDLFKCGIETFSNAQSTMISINVDGHFCSVFEGGAGVKRTGIGISVILPLIRQIHP